MNILCVLSIRPILILLLFLSSCNWANLDTKKSGMHKNSSSIAESKTNGVFRWVVHANKPVLSIGNNTTDTIKEAWVENMWMYDAAGNIVKDSTYQLELLFGNSSISYNDKFLLRCGNKYFGWNAVFSIDVNYTNGTIYVMPAEEKTNIIYDSFRIAR
jgi:hypothetical protein